jgi:hypothetical protein
MGQLSKTITLRVPVEVAYQSCKDKSYLDYAQDLLEGLTPLSNVTKDIPNKIYAETSAWGTKIEVEFLFRPLGEDSCEITINYRTGPDFEPLTRQSMIGEIAAFKTLEFGYRAGKEYIQSIFHPSA